MLKNSSFSSVEEKSFDENSSQELSLESLSEISGGKSLLRSTTYWGKLSTARIKTEKNLPIRARRYKNGAAVNGAAVIVAR